MRKFCCLLLVLILLFLCSCSETKAKDDEIADEVVINIPDGATNDYQTVNKNDDSVSSKTESVTPNLQLLYYANTNTKKFHKNSCRYANSISNERLYITESREELIGEGYEPCKVCAP